MPTVRLALSRHSMLSMLESQEPAGKARELAVHGMRDQYRPGSLRPPYTTLAFLR